MPWAARSSSARARGRSCRAVTEAGGSARICRLGMVRPHLAPVYETVSRVRGALGAGHGADRLCRRALDGRELHGRGRVEPRLPARSRRMALDRSRSASQSLIDLLVEATIEHLSAQIEAGAEAVQIFDSWAGALPGDALERWCIEPTRRIVQALRARHGPVPIIGFPRGARRLSIAPMRAAPASTASASTNRCVPGWAAETAAARRRAAGQSRSGLSRRSAARRMRGGGAPHPGAPGATRAFVFNLGHGVLPRRRPSMSPSSRAGAWPEVSDGARWPSCCSISAARTSRRRSSRSCVNLFNDPAIIGAAAAAALAARAADLDAARAPVARKIYAQLGGGSPLLRQYRGPGAGARGGARRAGTRSRVHRHALLASVARETALRRSRPIAPERIVLLPLYPQFSTTTTGLVARTIGDAPPQRSGSIVPTSRGLLLSDRARLHRGRWRRRSAAALDGRARRTARRACCSRRMACRRRSSPTGDPYQRQVEETAAAVVAALGLARARLDRLLSEPGRAAGMDRPLDRRRDRARRPRQGVPIVVVPIAFVSEHSETLVELDIEYRDLAEQRRRAGLSPGADGRHRAGLHRRACATWCARPARCGPATADGNARLCRPTAAARAAVRRRPGAG